MHCVRDGDGYGGTYPVVDWFERILRYHHEVSIDQQIIVPDKQYLQLCPELRSGIQGCHACYSNGFITGSMNRKQAGCHCCRSTPYVSIMEGGEKRGRRRACDNTIHRLSGHVDSKMASPPRRLSGNVTIPYRIVDKRQPLG